MLNTASGEGVAQSVLHRAVLGGGLGRALLRGPASVRARDARRLRSQAKESARRGQRRAPVPERQLCQLSGRGHVTGARVAAYASFVQNTIVQFPKPVSAGGLAGWGIILHVQRSQSAKFAL